MSLQYPMLTKHNYSAWAMKLKVYMEAHGVWDAVESEEPVERRKDRMALAVIFQGISEETLLKLGSKTSAKDAWNKLRTMHLGATRVKEVQAQALRCEIEGLKIEMQKSDVATSKDSLPKKAEETEMHIDDVGTSEEILPKKAEENDVPTSEENLPKKAEEIKMQNDDVSASKESLPKKAEEIKMQNDDVSASKESLLKKEEEIDMQKTDNDVGKRKQVDSDSGGEENTKDKSNKKKKPSVDSELEENSLNSAYGTKKKSKEKKQSEDPELEENNNDGRRTKKRKKKKENTRVDKDETTPSRMSYQKGSSFMIMFLPTKDEESEVEDDEREVEQVRGKWFTKEEEELIKKSILEDEGTTRLRRSVEMSNLVEEMKPDRPVSIPTGLK